MPNKPGTITFAAAFAPGRKCLQVDAEGEALIQLVVPESDAAKIMAAFPHLKDDLLVVTVGVA